MQERLLGRARRPTASRCTRVRSETLVCPTRVNKFAIDTAASSTSSRLSTQSRESTTAGHASHVVEGFPRVRPRIWLSVNRGDRVQRVAVVDNKRNEREICVHRGTAERPIQAERERERGRRHVNRINESKEKVIARFVNESTQRANILSSPLIHRPSYCAHCCASTSSQLIRAH